MHAVLKRKYKCWRGNDETYTDPVEEKWNSIKEDFIDKGGL